MTVREACGLVQSGPVRCVALVQAAAFVGQGNFLNHVLSWAARKSCTCAACVLFLFHLYLPRPLQPNANFVQL